MILHAKNKQNVRFLDFYRLKKRHSKTKMANAIHTHTHTDVPIWPTSNACNCVHESKSRAYFSFSYFRSVAFDIISSHSGAFYNQTYKLANNLPFFSLEIIPNENSLEMMKIPGERHSQPRTILFDIYGRSLRLRLLLFVLKSNKNGKQWKSRSCLCRECML